MVKLFTLPSANNAHIQFVKKSKKNLYAHFRNTNTKQKYKGVHDAVESVFAKGYDYKKAIHDLTPPKVRARKQHGQRRKKPVAKTAKQGKSRGTRLDVQLTKTVDIYRKYQCSMEVFYDENALNAFKGKLTTTERSFLTNKLYLEEVKCIWKWCFVNKISPIATQLRVHSAYINRATEIDLVGVTERNEIILFECKRGFVNYHYKHNGMLRYPYHKHHNHPYNQHQLQLFLNTVLFRDTFPKHQVAMSYLFRVDENDFDAYPLDDWVVQPRDRAIAVLRALA
jgi:hypothetical protein